jgi:hypothetical protein
VSEDQNTKVVLWSAPPSVRRAFAKDFPGVLACLGATAESARQQFLLNGVAEIEQCQRRLAVVRRDLNRERGHVVGSFGESPGLSWWKYAAFCPGSGFENLVPLVVVRRAVGEEIDPAAARRSKTKFSRSAQHHDHRHAADAHVGIGREAVPLRCEHKTGLVLIVASRISVSASTKVASAARSHRFNRSGARCC